MTARPRQRDHHAGDVEVGRSHGMWWELGFARDHFRSSQERRRDSAVYVLAREGRRVGGRSGADSYDALRGPVLPRWRIPPDTVLTTRKHRCRVVPMESTETTATTIRSHGDLPAGVEVLVYFEQPDTESFVGKVVDTGKFVEAPLYCIRND